MKKACQRRCKNVVAGRNSERTFRLTRLAAEDRVHRTVASPAIAEMAARSADKSRPCPHSGKQWTQGLRWCGAWPAFPARGAQGDLHDERDREPERAAAQDHRVARELPERRLGQQADLAGAAQHHRRLEPRKQGMEVGDEPVRHPLQLAAIELAREGAHVALISRDKTKACAARTAIQAAVPCSRGRSLR